MTIISVSDFKILGIAAKAWMATLIPQIPPSLRSPAVPDCLPFPHCHFTALPLCALTALSAIPLWTLVHPLQWYSNVTPSRKPFPLARGNYCLCCQHLTGPLILRSVVCFEAYAVFTTRLWTHGGQAWGCLVTAYCVMWYSVGYRSQIKGYHLICQPFMHWDSR